LKEEVMSDQASERVGRQEDGRDELIDFAGLPCLKSVQEAFEQHNLGFFEAMVVLREWTDISRWAREGIILDGPGSVSKGHRKVSWVTVGDAEVMTIEGRYEPKVYSLEWRARREADGSYGAYVHAFWLGGPDQRPSGGDAE